MIDDASARQDVRRRATPFLAALVLALAVLPLSIEEIDADELILAGAASLALMLGAVLVPWWRLPYWAGAIPPLAAIAVVAMLRDAAGGNESGYSPLLLLPVLWMALYRTRAEVIAAVAAVLIALVAPILLFGAPEYPDSEWRRIAVLTGIAVFFGLLTHALVARVRDREDYLSDVMNSAAEGIITLDRHGRVQLVNPSAAELLGARGIAGRELHAVVHGDEGHPAAECPLTVPVREGRRRHVAEDEFTRADGTRIPVEAWATPIDRAGRVDGAVITFSDITERREVVRLKDEFVSVVGHELRTPLTSIRGSLGLMEGGVFGKLPDEAQKMLAIATSNTDRLVRLINDILDVQRIEAGKATLQRRPVAVAELLESARATMAAMAEESGVRLHAEVAGAPVADADADRVQQTLTNLLSNAIKFSPAGGDVRVRAAVEADRVAIEVADEGRGIPADKLDSVFERFEQVDASDARQRGGSGLGLAIARGIVRQHGGDLTVTSAEGRGSTFRFDLPLAEQPAPGGQEPLTVLVCDPDADQRARSGAVLAGWGYEVREAGSQAEAVAAAEDGHALVLLDAALSPGGACEAVDSLRAVSDAPVVLVGALGGDGEPRLPLAKPWSRESLAHAVAPGGLALIVEDEPELAGVLAAVLERNGVRSELAGGVAEARAALDRLAPDLIVLDLGLPDGDGGEIVDRLREQGRLGSVAIVVYTARDVGDAEQDRLAGAEILTKARVGPQELERRAMALLGRAAGAPR